MGLAGKMKSVIRAVRHRDRRDDAPSKRQAPVASDDYELPPDIALSDTQTKKVENVAAIFGCDKAAAAKEIYVRAIAAMPNQVDPTYLLPNLDMRHCERISDELVRLEINNGRVFVGQRSEIREYVHYQIFRRHLPEAITGDTYKLALDVERRYFGIGLNWILGDGGTYVEGGCYTGIKAIRWHDLATKPVRILAVEIGRNNFEIMQTNIKANGLEHSIIPIHAGLWSESGQGTHKHDFSTFRFLEDTDRFHDRMLYEEPVSLLTLDDLLDEHQVEVADFVNIQVNGAELEVLKGLKRNLDRVKAIGIAAYYEQDGKKMADVIQEYLESVGCTIIRRSLLGRVTAVTAKFRDEIMARRPRRHAAN